MQSILDETASKTIFTKLPAPVGSKKMSKFSNEKWKLKQYEEFENKLIIFYLKFGGGGNAKIISE